MAAAQTYGARVFLFLQGPHGPFFDELAHQLRQSGARTLRVGFNAGDRVFWRDRASYIAFQGAPDDWAKEVGPLMAQHGVTDLVLYGDTRSIHATAVEQAKTAGIHVHVFEEGYLRPYWISYEKGGSNGHSPVMGMSMADIERQFSAGSYDPPVPPSHWGDMRQHVFYGAMYHFFLLAWNRGYPNFTAHRSLNVAQEFRLYLRKLLLMPFTALERRIATARVRFGSFPYHLVLLQLEHDSSFQMHGPFDSQTDFIDAVLDGFAKGAPRHHHLVFKAHPLEDGRAPLRAHIRQRAKAMGVFDRIHFIRGGKLAGILNEARSAVTVNSTAGQQALWRGIPLKAFGRAVYSKPELVSSQPLARFFSAPDRPDTDTYRLFRDFLLSTSQLPGSFYAAKGRRQVVRTVTDMMLEGHDPYTATRQTSAADKQQLRIVQ